MINLLKGGYECLRILSKILLASPERFSERSREWTITGDRAFLDLDTISHLPGCTISFNTCPLEIHHSNALLPKIFLNWIIKKLTVLLLVCYFSIVAVTLFCLCTVQGADSNRWKNQDFHKVDTGYFRNEIHQLLLSQVNNTIVQRNNVDRIFRRTRQLHTKKVKVCKNHGWFQRKQIFTHGSNKFMELFKKIYFW